MTRTRWLVAAVALLAAGTLTAFTYELVQPASAHPHHHVVVGDGANGKRVTIRVGEVLTLRLDSTYWTIAGSPNGSVLATQGTERVHGTIKGCVPGEGCGTAARDFLGKAAGSVTLTASRTSCGEALRCTGSNGSFTVHVVVR